MRFSVSSASFVPRHLATAFAWAKEAGFDGLELAILSGRWGPNPSHVLGLSHRCGIPVLSIHAPLLPPLGMNPHKRLQRTLTLAQELGGVLVTFHLPPPGNTTARHSLLASRGHGIPIAIENFSASKAVGPWSKLGSYDDYLRELRRFVEAGNFAVTFDTSHAGAIAGDPLPAYELLKDRIANIHLSDFIPRALPFGRSLLASYFVEHQVPGRGTLPLGEFLQRLGRDGYQGLVTVEANPWAMRVWSARRFKAALSHSLAFCRQHALAPAPGAIRQSSTLL